MKTQIKIQTKVTTAHLKIFFVRKEKIMLPNTIALLTSAAAAGGSGTNPFETIVAPVINLLNQVLTPAIFLVAALGAVYCVFLGVKLAKAEEPQDREKAKNALKNAIVGFVLIFVLVVVLRVAITPMMTWMNENSAATGIGAAPSAAPSIIF